MPGTDYADRSVIAASRPERHSQGRRLRPTSDGSRLIPPVKRRPVVILGPVTVNGTAERRNLPGQRVIDCRCQEIRPRIGEVRYLVVPPRVGSSTHVTNIDRL